MKEKEMPNEILYSVKMPLKNEDEVKGTKADYIFKVYASNNFIDAELLTSPNDSIVVMYRKDGAHQWESVDFSIKGNGNAGIITVENIQSGDYVLGAWDEEHAGLKEINNNSSINIYPNPTKDYLNIELNNETKGNVIISNQFRIFTICK